MTSTNAADAADDYKRRSAAAWGAGAGAYAAMAHEGDGGGYMQLMQHITDDVALALGGKEGGAAVLDVGFGSGQPALQIAKALPECSVTCTDLAPGMVQEALRRAEAAGVTNFR